MLMLFSELLETLKSGETTIIDFNIGNDPHLHSADSLEVAQQNQLSYVEHDSYLIKAISITQASVVLIPNEQAFKNELNTRSIAWAVSSNPKLAFAESLDILYPSNIYKPSIHKTACLEQGVRLGDNVFIGANVFVGENTNIGSNCIIHPGVVIYNNVQISDNCVIDSNCVIHQNSEIGANCIFQSNSVIGSEGFGFVPTSKGWRKMPQIGKVIIEDNVEIGACSTIDRPALGKTIVGKGTKLDNLVQIGHGVKIGKNCAMASQVGIAGGAIIEDGVILAGQVGVGNRVRIGKGVIASSKCGVHTNVEPGQVVSGFPAMPNKLWLRCSANFKKLPELAKAIRNLTNTI